MHVTDGTAPVTGLVVEEEQLTLGAFDFYMYQYRLSFPGLSINSPVAMNRILMLPDLT